MLSKNPVKFQDSGSHALSYASRKMKYGNFKQFLWNVSKFTRGGNKTYEGAQQLMLGNNPVKFQDSSMNGI